MITEIIDELIGDNLLKFNKENPPTLTKKQRVILVFGHMNTAVSGHKKNGEAIMAEYQRIESHKATSYDKAKKLAERKWGVICAFYKGQLIYSDNINA